MKEHKARDESPQEFEAINAEISREKSVRTGHISAIHSWWARRPNVLARVATYLAITEQRKPEPHFVTGLGVLDPSSDTINEARSNVRDTSWRWHVQEMLSQGVSPESVASDSPSAPKVLDPFAGGGSIPMEASRLGCETYAGDLNPLACRILRATLEYPATLFPPDITVNGTGDGGTWRGLIAELRVWARILDEAVSKRVADLFPPEPQTRIPIDRYFWFLFVRCSSPSCGSEYPIQTVLRLTTRPSLAARFEWKDGQPSIHLVGVASSPEPNRLPPCPVCGSQQQNNGGTQDKSWRLCLTRKETDKSFLVVPEQSVGEFVPWTAEHDARLYEFLSRIENQSVQGDLPSIYRHIALSGLTSFRDLFTSRQLLVNAEYVGGVREIIERINQVGLPQRHGQALGTYLSLFLGYLVRQNSKLCSWSADRGDANDSFVRPTPILPSAFVERLPFGLMERWLDSLIPAIETAARVAPAKQVFQGDATALPFEDDFFDAVVTDPPYYDSVPYSDLADFFWVWEQLINCDPGRTEIPLSPKATELVANRAGGDGPLLYREGMLKAFREVHRVLRPGRRFCLIFSGRATERFQDYVDLCQDAGLELVDVKRVPEQVAGLSESAAVLTYLIYFRKPIRPQVREPLQAAEAPALLAAAAEGKPVLYAGLAELMVERLSTADLADILPAGGKGNVVEQVMEVLADEDPREVLEKCFGKVGLRVIASELSNDANHTVHASPLEHVLAHFGLSAPSNNRPDGAAQVRQKIRRMSAKIANARTKDDMRGPFLEACTAVERLLRLAAWGWAQVAFGSQRDEQIMRILKQQNSERRYDLNRLAMGDIFGLFRNLPDAMAMSPAASTIERKFGRRHVYSPKKTRLVEVLDQLVSLRNKVEHDKDAYWSNSEPGRARNDLARVLAETERLFIDLVESKAVPLIVEPIKEIRDRWNRVSYVLSIDDGTEREAHFSSRLMLGACYLYFGAETNPKPVDPLILSIGELGKIA